MNLAGEAHHQEIASNRNSTIDLMRMLAILIVVLSHGVMDFKPTIPPVIEEAVWGLIATNLGVPLFFVISGYLVTQQIQNDDVPNVRYFYIRRIAKIYPTYVLLLLVYIMSGAVNPNHAGWFILSLQNTGVIPPLSPPGHLWSIAVEVQFYILAPLIASGKSPLFKTSYAFGSWLLVSISVMILSAYFLQTQVSQATLADLVLIVYCNLLTNLPALCFGIWLYGQYGAENKQIRRSPICNPIYAIILSAVSNIFLYVTHQMATPNHVFTEALGNPSSYIALMLTLVWFSLNAALFANFCLSLKKYVPHLGNNHIALASYQWYLVHPLFLSNTWFHTYTERWSSGAQFWSYVIASFATAFALFHYIEEPFRKLVIGFFRSRTRSA